MIEWTKARPRQKCSRPDCDARATLTRGRAGRCDDHRPSVYEVEATGVAGVEETALPPHLRVMLRSAETRLACEAARRRGRMYLADAASDPDSARKVIAEMVALLEQAPAPAQSVDQPKAAVA